MDLRQLECFLKVADPLHFGRAAEELFIGQPTVSEAVRRLEREIGGALFDRTTRHVALTPLGQTFLETAREAYQAVTDAYTTGQAAARREMLDFVVGSTGDFGRELIEATAAFHRCSPDVTVTLQTMSTPRQLQAIRERRLNVGICWAPQADPATFIRRFLGTSRLIAVLRADHPLAAESVVQLKDLAAEPLFAWARSANPQLYDELCAALDDAGAPWAFVGTASGIQSVAARVLSGLGVAILVESFNTSLPIPGVTVVPIDTHLPGLVREVVWRRNDHHLALHPFVEQLTAAALHLDGQPRRLMRDAG